MVIRTQLCTSKVTTHISNTVQVRVGEEEFLLKKEVENIIENKWPSRYRSRYAMVCYCMFVHAGFAAGLCTYQAHQPY
jgi:uncharacterized membrane protein YbjE (DUF340 family)